MGMWGDGEMHGIMWANPNPKPGHWGPLTLLGKAGLTKQNSA